METLRANHTASAKTPTHGKEEGCPQQTPTFLSPVPGGVRRPGETPGMMAMAAVAGCTGGTLASVTASQPGLGGAVGSSKEPKRKLTYQPSDTEKGTRPARFLAKIAGPLCATNTIYPGALQEILKWHLTMPRPSHPQALEVPALRTSAVRPPRHPRPGST